MGFVVINASADVIVCKLQLLSVDNAKRLSVSNFTFYLFDFTIKDYLSKTWRNSRIIFVCWIQLKTLLFWDLTKIFITHSVIDEAQTSLQENIADSLRI